MSSIFVVFLGHPFYECDGFRGDMRFVVCVFRLATAVDTKKLPVPMEVGIRLHKVQSLLPKLGKFG